MAPGSAGPKGQSSANNGNLAGQAKLNDLNRQMTLASESLTARTRENNELKSRVSELEALLKKKNRLITLKNEQLAELQQDLSSPKSFRLLEKLLRKKQAIQRRQVGYFVDPQREYMEYEYFLNAIIDDTDLLNKADWRDLECVAELLNRMKSFLLGYECEIIALDDLAKVKGDRKAAIERFLKNDDLGDPMINEYHIESFGWAEKAHVEKMKTLTLAANDVLKKLFFDSGMLLVDYKLEFGLFDGDVLLGDEMTPDGCRLWDVDTREKLDKDRFRQGLGDVVESYEIVGRRLGMDFG